MVFEELTHCRGPESFATSVSVVGGEPVREPIDQERVRLGREIHSRGGLEKKVLAGALETLGYSVPSVVMFAGLVAESVHPLGLG